MPGLKVLKETPLYEDRWVSLSNREFEYPNGKTLYYAFIHVMHGGYVMVCPRTSDGLYIMAKQSKPAAGESIEFVAGGLKQNESFEQAAAREMQEEVGYAPGRLVEVGKFMNVTDRMDSVCHLYLAFDCVKTKRTQGDEAQDIECILFSEADVQTAISTGKIKDMATVLGFYAHLIHDRK